MMMSAACAPAPASPQETGVPTPVRTAAPTPLPTTESSLTPTSVASGTAGPTPSPTPNPPRQSLDEAVQSALGRHQGTIGVVVAALHSGQTFSVNADRRFRAASL